MSIDFDKIIDRKNTSCMKWDSNKDIFGSDDILPMWIADMDFEVPQSIYEALKTRLEHKVYGYTYRDEEYNKTIINWVKRRYSWDIKKEWITFSPGIVPALSMSILGNTKPGDKIIIMTPVYGHGHRMKPHSN